MALFSALEQTLCALVKRNSQWVAVALLKWCTFSAVWLLHGWCHVKLLPSRRTFCVHHTTMHQFTVSLHSKTNTTVHVCSAVTWHLHLWQNATAVTRGWNGYRNKSQHRKWTLEKKILLQLLSGLEPATLRSRVRRSTTELSMFHSLIWGYCADTAFRVGDAVILGQCTVTLCVMDLLSFGVSVLLHSMLDALSS